MTIRLPTGRIRTPESSANGTADRWSGIRGARARLGELRPSELRLPDAIPPDIGRRVEHVLKHARMRTSELARRNPFAERRRRETRRRRLALLAVAGFAGAVGATLALLLDPDRGRSRRAYARDRLAATARRVGRATARASRHAGSTVSGVAGSLARPGAEGRKPDDATLAHKVETVLFRDRTIDKGRLNVNAQYGVVYLRGTAESPERISEIEDQTRRIAGVQDVENLLHLPGTPAPMEPPRIRVAGVASNGDRQSVGSSGR